MAYQIIISTAELEKLLTDARLVIVDCRFDLANSDWGYLGYQESHIPSAIYAHLNKDLAGPVTPNTGRHPLPEPGRFSDLLASWGIEPGVQVVVYDTVSGAYAARLWWMLRAIGHNEVAILDGGFTSWLSEDRPLASGIESCKASSFHYKVGFPGDYLATTGEVEQLHRDPGNLLIDARAPERYRGEIEPIDSIAGRIPGAANRFHGQNLTQDGTLKPPEQLRAEFDLLLNGIEPDQVVVYCGSGVTSCLDLAAMELAGLKGARLYAGSWSEWIRDPRRPRLP